MNKNIVETKLNEKTIRCIFIFDDYKKRDYDKDFYEFISYQQKGNLYKFKKEDLKKELDLKFYNQIKNFEYIPYNTFKSYITSLFSKVLFDLLKDNPDFIIADELNIQIRIIRVEDREYYFFSKDNISNPKNACYDAAGIWFIQTIVAPFYYFKKFDYQLIRKYFLHELTHFLDNMNMSYLFETKHQKDIYKYSKIKATYSLNFLYNSMYNLREEGFPDFMARKDTGRFDINKKFIDEYNSNLRNLIQLPKNKMKRFYDNEIGVHNLTPSTEYVNGRNMCVLIALMLSDKDNQYSIQVGNNKIKENISNLDKLLSTNKTIYITLSKELIDKTIKEIKPIVHFNFIRLYEKACDSLNISNQNRIMTMERFFSLEKDAINISNKKEAKELKSSGFYSK